MNDSAPKEPKVRRVPVTTVLEEATIKQARLLAAVQNTTISKVFEAAVVAYLHAHLSGALEGAGITRLLGS